MILKAGNLVLFLPLIVSREQHKVYIRDVGPSTSLFTPSIGDLLIRILSHFLPAGFRALAESHYFNPAADPVLRICL